MEPNLSGLFTPDTCLETNPHSTESDSLIWKFSYPDSQPGNGGVRISEAPLYVFMIYIKMSFCLVNVLNMPIYALFGSRQIKYNLLTIIM